MRHYQIVVSRTAYRAILRPLRRAVDPSRPYDLPRLPRLAIGRLESLLDVLEAGRRRQRAVWLRMTDRSASTLDAWIGHLLRSGDMPRSARSAREHAQWVAGLD